MRFSILLGGLACAMTALAQTPAASDDVLTSANYKPLTGDQRLHRYWNETLFSPLIYAAALAGAGINQLENDPPEWRQGVKGYAKRSASVLGVLTIEETIQQGGAAMLHYDPRYIHCDCKGFVKRSGHAVFWTLLTKNSAGATRLDLPVIAGAYGSGMLSTLWYPDRYDPLKDGVRSGTYQLGIRVGVNWAREFSPELRRAVHLGR